MSLVRFSCFIEPLQPAPREFNVTHLFFPNSCQEIQLNRQFHFTLLTCRKIDKILAVDVVYEEYPVFECSVYSLLCANPGANNLLRVLGQFCLNQVLSFWKLVNEVSPLGNQHRQWVLFQNWHSVFGLTTKAKAQKKGHLLYRVG